jgi:CelD/BcsL family acetyltransferase involved in cellulose biosynthesis
LGQSVAAMARAGTAWVSVARDQLGVQAGLVTLSQNGYAMALLVAATPDPDYRPFSLGTHVFDAGIEEAVRRGCHTYDFLWLGSYKQEFWHAQPRYLESAVVGRGVVGRLAAHWLARREGRVGRAADQVVVPGRTAP